MQHEHSSKFTFCIPQKNISNTVTLILLPWKNTSEHRNADSILLTLSLFLSFPRGQLNCWVSPQQVHYSWIRDCLHEKNLPTWPGLIYWPPDVSNQYNILSASNSNNSAASHESFQSPLRTPTAHLPPTSTPWSLETIPAPCRSLAKTNKQKKHYNTQMKLVQASAFVKNLIAEAPLTIALIWKVPKPHYDQPDQAGRPTKTSLGWFKQFIFSRSNRTS